MRFQPLMPDNPSIELIKTKMPSGIFTNYIYKAIPLAFDESLYIMKHCVHYMIIYKMLLHLH